MGDDLIDILFKETNRYDHQNNSSNNTNSNKEWIDTSIIDMNKFIGPIILMRFLRKIKIRDYWSTSPLL